MKSTMMMTAAFARRQNNRVYHTVQASCGRQNYGSVRAIVAPNILRKSLFTDTKAIAPLLLSSSPSSLYTARTTCFHSTLRDSSSTNGYTTARVYSGTGTHTGSSGSALLQSNCFVRQQPESSSPITISNYQQQQIRNMGTKKNKESKNQKNKAKQKSMIKKQKLQIEQQKLVRQQQKQQQQEVIGDEHSLTAASVTSTSPNTKAGPAEQHKEWVEFQKSIEVDGFETGQTLTAIDASKKGRSGGKVATKKRMTKRNEMAEKIKERQRLAGGGGGEFPPMRYSDEETERLLQQAYAAIPKRMGKRGTLQLKRQKRRWHLVREIHRKYKEHIVKFHFRRMERRSTKMKQIIDFISNVAPNAVQEDAEYQNNVRQRYMRMIETAATLRAQKIAASSNALHSETSGSALTGETIESHAA